MASTHHVLEWPRHGDPREVVLRAARTLADGGVVAFPAETVYTLVASALVPDAVERLCRATERPADRPLTLAVRGTGDALDWVPAMSAVGRRLARRCWPGPVTLRFVGRVEQGVMNRLPESVRQRVCPAGALALRAPEHESLHRAARLLPGPLVLAGARRGDAHPAVTAEQVMQGLGEAVDVVLDDGPSRYGQSATVIQVNGDGWQVVREGVVPSDLLRRQTARLVLFVCTGNTCRSPLAEALCKKLLAERLGCTPEELPERGFLVLSAGLAALGGGGAAIEAIEAARDRGADLAGHRSRLLTADLADQADDLIAMTQAHLLALAGQFPQAAARARLLRSDGLDIPDPIGGEQHVYRECAQEITGHLERLVTELVVNSG